MYGQEVCLFGDSIARGIILDAQGSYKPIKECFASLAASELGFGLINKARFGCTIPKGREIIEHFLSRVDSETRRLAFLEFGGKDCDFRWAHISADPHAVQFIYRWHESYSSAIWEIGETHHVPVADIRKAILEERNYSRFLCKDGIHPNAEGHQLIKSEIIKFAKEHQADKA